MNLRYTKEELGTIKDTYAENTELLINLRKLMLQLPMNALDISQLTSAFNGNEPLIRITKRIFSPQIEGNEPLNQVVDLRMVADIKNKMFEDAVLTIKANELSINYIDQQLELLENIKDLQKASKKLEIIFKDLIETGGKTDEQMYINLLARNTIVASVEARLNQLFVLAGSKTESLEDQEKRLSQDSNK